MSNHHHRPRVTSVLIVAATLGACVSGRAPETTATQGEDIQISTVDEDTPARNSSVKLIAQATGSRCTGTLITPLRVLTANHCLVGSSALGAFPEDPGSGERAMDRRLWSERRRPEQPAGTDVVAI